MAAIDLTSSACSLELGALPEGSPSVADELEGRPEEGLPGLVERRQLSLAQRGARAPASVERPVEPAHQAVGRLVLAPPESLLPHGRGRRQETAATAHQLLG